MRVIYKKTIEDKVRKAIYEAQREEKEIKEIQLSCKEYHEFMYELPPHCHGERFSGTNREFRYNGIRIVVDHSQG